MSSRDEGIIDVERRKDTAEYTLGDPTVFPPEFLVWLKRYIEQSGITLPASAIFGTFSSSTGSVRNLAAGIVLPFAGGTTPPGSLPCDGGSYARSNYPLLFDAIGTLYGAVDGLHFNVPDYRDRSLFGSGTLAVGANDGRPIGQRGPSHHHDISLTSGGGGDHSHSVGGSTSGVGDHTHTYGIASPNFVSIQQGTAGTFKSPVDTLTYPNGSTGNGGAHSHSISGNTNNSGNHTHSVSGSSSGGGGADSPGYGIVLYVITTG